LTRRREGESARRRLCGFAHSPVLRLAGSLKEGNLLKVAITGGMGTGKATVADICGRLGALVIDADEIAHEVIAPGTEGWKRVVEFFGRELLRSDGTVDRKALAHRVFGDPAGLAQLVSIVHPRVIAEVDRRLAVSGREGNYTVAVVNVPLLYEAGMEKRFDRVVVVTCPPEEQVRRCQRRNGLSREEVERRMKAQMPLEEKVARADCVIDNGGTREETEEQVRDVWKQLTGGNL